MFSSTYLAFFHHKICALIIFICFKFPQKKLTNQKQELLVQNCQLNCIEMHADTRNNTGKINNSTFLMFYRLRLDKTKTKYKDFQSCRTSE